MSTNPQYSTNSASLTNPDTSPFVTVHFPVQGRQLPADHGYALYSAITQHLPCLHNASWLGVELLSGVPWCEGIIVLPSRGATLRLRIPADRYGYLLPLTGRRLDIAGYHIHLGIPVARPVQPARSLYAHIVIIEDFNEPETFIDAVRRQVDALGLKADLELPIDEQGRFHRHIVKIHGRLLSGFSLAAHNLGDDDSLQLQGTGVGEHRAMGCGIFNPIANSFKQKEQRW